MRGACTTSPSPSEAHAAPPITPATSAAPTHFPILIFPSRAQPSSCTCTWIVNDHVHGHSRLPPADHTPSTPRALPPTLPAMNRNDMLAALDDRREPWDVVVIGGGATGLGVAVDAATRGYRTLLLE